MFGEISTQIYLGTRGGKERRDNQDLVRFWIAVLIDLSPHNAGGRNRDFLICRNWGLDRTI
jgi:hypothetical protein